MRNLKSRSDQGANNLKIIFDTMSYNHEISLENPLKLYKDRTIASRINGKSLTNGSDTTREFGAFGEVYKANLITDLAALSEAFKSVPGKAGGDGTPCPEGLLKLQELLKTKQSELVNLEAIAGQVPAWAIEKYDVPNWSNCLKDSAVTQMREEFQRAASTVIIGLDFHSYSLRNCIIPLAAAVQTQKPVNFVLHLKDDDQVRLVLPIFHLIEAVNAAGTSKSKFNIFIVSSKLAEHEVLGSLGQDAVLIERSIAGKLKYSRAVLNSTSRTGVRKHFIVTDSADVHSAVSSISRNVWTPGITINHACRPLLFVHQSLYQPILQYLKNHITENISVADGGSDASTKVDFIPRTSTPNETLSCIKTLGAKTISKSDDVSRWPTVVYDIGTSSDLVALPTPGLGHVLVAIPYRSLNELCSLGNNFDVVEEVFVYSTNFTATMEIAEKLKGKEIIINDAKQDRSVTDLPWAVVSPSSSVEKVTESKRTLKVSPNKAWNDLETQDKISKLQKFLSPQKAATDFLVLLMTNLKALKRQSPQIQRPLYFGTNAIFFVSAADIPSETVMFAIATCCLKGGSTLVGFLDTKIPEGVAEGVKTSLPAGLVTLINLNSVGEIKSLSEEDCEVIWITHGEGTSIPSEVISNGVANKLLLINGTNDNCIHANASVIIKNFL